MKTKSAIESKELSVVAALANLRRLIKNDLLIS